MTFRIPFMQYLNLDFNSFLENIYNRFLIIKILKNGFSSKIAKLLIVNYKSNLKLLVIFNFQYICISILI